LRVKIAALFFAAAVLLPACGASDEPDEVDWLEPEFDPAVVAERTAAEATPTPEPGSEEEAQSVYEYYIGVAEEAETEKARLEAELAEIKILIDLIRDAGDEELALKYEQLARDREFAILECDEDAALAEEMLAVVEAGRAAYGGAPEEEESEEETEDEPPETDKPAEPEAAPEGGG
jgi:hypothetical protein